jgi:hypothetical protein
VNGQREPFYEHGDLAFRRILECDADAFAWDASSWVQIQEGMTDTIRDLAPNVPWCKRDFALILYFAAIGVLFRILYDEKTTDVTHSEFEHPHPAVRSCLVCSYTFARAAVTSNAPLISLAECMGVSIRNIEEVWADLLLPGKFPKSAKVWAAEINHHAMELCSEYRRRSPELDARARSTRRWARTLDVLAGER